MEQSQHNDYLSQVMLHSYLLYYTLLLFFFFKHIVYRSFIGADICLIALLLNVNTLRVYV